MVVKALQGGAIRHYWGAVKWYARRLSRAVMRLPVGSRWRPVTSGKSCLGKEQRQTGMRNCASWTPITTGVINNPGRSFSKLVLFRDNSNGLQEEGELIGLKAGEINWGYGITIRRQRAVIGWRK